MNVHDYATRQGQRQDAADAKPCEQCSHPRGEHFERAYGSEGYAPLVFFCKHDGCSCRVSLGPEANVAADFRERR